MHRLLKTSADYDWLATLADTDHDTNHECNFEGIDAVHSHLDGKPVTMIRSCGHAILVAGHVEDRTTAILSWYDSLPNE